MFQNNLRLQQLLIFVFVFSNISWGYTSKRSGVVAQYVFELDATGGIDPQTMYLPFSANFLYNWNKSEPKNLNSKEFAELLIQANRQPSLEHKLHVGTRPKELRLKRIVEQTQLKSQFFYVDHKGNWHQLTLGPMVTFKVLEDGRLYLDTTVHANSNDYLGYRYVYSTSKVDTFGYHVGKRIITATPRPQRYLIFINGYRGPQKEDDPSRNEVAFRDLSNYWYKLDHKFDSVLQPQGCYYLDASFSVRTSNHRSNLRFAWSYLRVRLAKGKRKRVASYSLLNQHVNASGFEYRKNQGKNAIYSLESVMQEQYRKGESINKDTIDIVCHSMGYAYMLGLMETMESKYVLRKIYIIAPESGQYQGYDWNKVTEVWQYGSNLGLKDADPLWEQDGVAPQGTVFGLEKIASSKGGRVTYPWNWTRKNFIDSHMTYNFHWIIDLLKKGEPGSVVR